MRTWTPQAQHVAVRCGCDHVVAPCGCSHDRRLSSKGRPGLDAPRASQSNGLSTSCTLVRSTIAPCRWVPTQTRAKNTDTQINTRSPEFVAWLCTRASRVARLRAAWQREHMLRTLCLHFGDNKSSASAMHANCLVHAMQPRIPNPNAHAVHTTPQVRRRPKHDQNKFRRTRLSTIWVELCTGLGPSGPFYSSPAIKTQGTTQHSMVRGPSWKPHLANNDVSLSC